MAKKTAHSGINHKLINKAEIARQLGISRSYVSLIVSGKRTNPEILKKIKVMVKDNFILTNCK